MTTYIVKEVNLDIGFVTIQINLPDNSEVDLTVDISSIATTDDTNEIQLRNALNQLVDNYVLSLIPPIRPRPIALFGMQGMAFNSAGD